MHIVSGLPLRVKKFYWNLLSGTYKRRIKNTFKYERLYLDELLLHDNLEVFPSKLVKVRERLKRRFQIEWLTEKSIGNLQSYLAYRQDIPEHEVIEWLRCGHVTVMAIDKGKIIGDCWSGIKSFPFWDRTIAEMFEKRGYAHSFMAFVDPRYRGLGIFPLLISEQVEVLRQKGIKALLGVGKPKNKRSIRSGKKMGFKYIYTLHLLRVMGKKYAKLTKVKW